MAKPLLLAAAGVLAYAMPAALAYSPAAGVVGVRRRLRSADSVALTFDDGPQPGATERFLDLLDRQGVRATFFLVGEHVGRFPGLVREVCVAGHEIGNHGYHHRNHFFRNPLGLTEDIRRGAEAIEDATGERPALYRPPYGVVTAVTRLAAAQTHSQVVLWTAWGHDWRPQATAESIAREVLDAAKGGGIILLHDADYYRECTWHVTFDAVPRIVETLRRRGLHVGPIGGSSALTNEQTAS